LIADSFSHLFSNFQYSRVNPKRNQIFHSMSKSSIFILFSDSLFLIKTHFELFDNWIFNHNFLDSLFFSSTALVGKYGRKLYIHPFSSSNAEKI
jgi:hypothetical protein